MRIIDQQLVIHAFAAADGPGAQAAYRAVDEIWRGCGRVFRMTESIPGANLPRLLSGGLAALPIGSEAAHAAQESRDADFQAVLRIHRDVLNLSVALAMPEGTAAAGGTDSAGEQWTWWRDLDARWRQLTESAAPHLLGEARLYLARVDDEAGIAGAAPALYQRLARLLPADAVVPQAAESAGVSLPRGFALWETATEPDERALRRFVLAIAPDADPAASAWAWSRGDTRIPPLAQYLLHAAKIRFELRVWQRDGRARELRNSLDVVGAELRRLGAADAASQELLRIRRRDTQLQQAELDDLRRTVAIAADNLGRAVDLAGLRNPGSPFADDTMLAESMLERLDDEIAYLDQSAVRADLSAEAPRRSATAPPTSRVSSPAGARPSTTATEPDESAAPGEPGESDEAAGQASSDSGDRRRKVFVVYGRDSQAELAIFDFLRAIDLHPLEWDKVVAETKSVKPTLAEAVLSGLAAAQAVVVLMTPDDVVRLHPELQEPNDHPAEAEESMQPRPNVLLELGMALMSHPDKALLLFAGEQRPVTDLGGINFVRIADTVACRQRIANRLALAGCAVDLTGNHWHKAGDFAALTALRRRPPGKGAPRLRGHRSSGPAADRPAGHLVGVAPAQAVAEAEPHVVEAGVDLAEPVRRRRLRGRLPLVDHGGRRVAQQPDRVREPPRVEADPQVEVVAPAVRHVQEVRGHPLAGRYPQPQRVLVTLAPAQRPGQHDDVDEEAVVTLLAQLSEPP